MRLTLKDGEISRVYPDLTTTFEPGHNYDLDVDENPDPEHLVEVTDQPKKAIKGVTSDANSGI